MSQNKIKVKIVRLGESKKSEPTVTYKVRKGTAKDGGSQHVAEAHCSENGHVGSAYFSGQGDHTHINFLDVHHEHRRKGYGAGLVSHVHDLHKKSNREGSLSYMSTGTRDWNTGKINEDEIEKSQGALFGGDLADNQRGKSPAGKMKVKVQKAKQAVGRMGRKVLKKFSDTPEIKFVPAAGEREVSESKRTFYSWTPHTEKLDELHAAYSRAHAEWGFHRNKDRNPNHPDNHTSPEVIKAVEKHKENESWGNANHWDEQTSKQDHQDQQKAHKESHHALINSHPSVKSYYDKDIHLGSEYRKAHRDMWDHINKHDVPEGYSKAKGLETINDHDKNVEKEHTRYLSIQQMKKEGEPKKVGESIEKSGEKFSGYNKPKKTPGKPKQNAVLAKEGTKVRIVRFGDPKSKIKKHIPGRKKNFRARHGCDKGKLSKLTAKYWSCKAW